MGWISEPAQSVAGSRSDVWIVGVQRIQKDRTWTARLWVAKRRMSSSVVIVCAQSCLLMVADGVANQPKDSLACHAHGPDSRPRPIINS